MTPLRNIIAEAIDPQCSLLKSNPARQQAAQQAADAALSAIAEAGYCVTGWQDIESAPKDGTKILAHAGGECYVIAWLNGEETDAGNDWWYVDDNKHGPFPLRGESPTHWIPLPKPPTTKE